MMTDERVQALRRGRGRPAQLSKIVTAGVAASTVLGLTAVLGWSAGAASPAPAAPQPLLDAGGVSGSAAAAMIVSPPAAPGVIPIAIPVAAPAARSTPDATTSGSH
jgi:hypothetical protein